MNDGSFASLGIGSRTPNLPLALPPLRAGLERPCPGICPGLAVGGRPLVANPRNITGQHAPLAS